MARGDTEGGVPGLCLFDQLGQVLDEHGDPSGGRRSEDSSPRRNISRSEKQCFHTGLRHLSVIHSTHSRNANGPDHLTVLHKQKPTFHGHGAR